VHYETRVPGSADSWASGSPGLQPFKSTVDPARQAVYWHKDMMQDFYGEVWSYDNDNVFLRQETFPHWPSDPPNTPWDVRPDRFRLFADATVDSGGGDYTSRFPGGRGRVLAPVHLAVDWSHSGNMSTFLCQEWADFHRGNCSLFQPHFMDTVVTARRWGGGRNFSTVFDGAVSGGGAGEWVADATMQSLRDVVVISQAMSGSGGGPATGRERFFFARTFNGTGVGIVRWDSSSANASAPDGYTVQARTVGLKLACTPGFNSSGFPARSAQDTHH
jgi:hypothetical protein